jgi:hypothetical protein
VVVLAWVPFVLLLMATRARVPSALNSEPDGLPVRLRVVPTWVPVVALITATRVVLLGSPLAARGEAVIRARVPLALNSDDDSAPGTLTAPTWVPVVVSITVTRVVLKSGEG